MSDFAALSISTPFCVACLLFFKGGRQAENSEGPARAMQSSKPCSSLTAILRQGIISSKILAQMDHEHSCRILR